MMWPWEQEPKLDYVTFMDAYLRVSVSMNGQPKRTFAVLDEGTNMNVEMIMPNGTPVTIKVEGHPRTTDPRITATELVDFILDSVIGNV